ncbi:Unknown protein, partial [Striga hermonthica]
IRAAASVVMPPPPPQNPTEAEFSKLEELGRGETKKEKAVSPKRRALPRREGRTKQDRGREDRWNDRPISGGKRFHDNTPLNTKVAEVLMAMEKGIEGKDVTWPRSRFEGPTQPKSRRYYRFHKDYGHTIEDCRHLKDEIERLIRAGHLKEFVYQDKVRGKEKRRCREKSVERSDEDDEEEPRGGRDGRKRGEGRRRRGSRERDGQGVGGQMKRGTIYMISGGPTDGDSNNARRGHVRAMKRKREEVGITARVPEISFRAEDATGVVIPHNDALVITAEVVGFDVKRVFIDTGSSIDVMFYDFFVQINLELNVELKLVATALYGFNGGEVMPMGEMGLSVALGKGATQKVRMVRFVVVGAESSYNIIMGRTSLNSFQAVVSTYHMTIKYP